MTGISNIQGRAVYILIEDWKTDISDIIGVFSSKSAADEEASARRTIDPWANFRVEEHFID